MQLRRSHRDCYVGRRGGLGVTRLGPYELGEVLGVGGLGTVYRSNGPDGPVAVKVIRADLAERPGFRTRLLREAQLAQRVQGPGIVRVVGVDAACAQPYLVTEFLDAPTLADEVTRFGPLTGDRLERFADSLIQALGAIHRAKVIHRDVKPTNVLVGSDGSAHVLDFGLAALAEHSDHEGEGRGTAGWMAPEVVAGQTPTVAADVYGWGLVVAFAATGRHLFANGPSEAPAELPGPLRVAVAVALDPAPERRRDAYVPMSFPSTPLDVAPTDLPPAMPGPTMSTTPTTQVMSKRLRKRPIAVVVAAVLAMVLLVVGINVARLRRETQPIAMLTIYDDSFQAGVALNKFNGLNDPASTGLVHSGKTAIGSSLVGSGAMFLHLPDDLALSKYTMLRFWARATTPGAVSISVAFTSDRDKPAGEAQSFTISNTAWTLVVFHLSQGIGDPTGYDVSQSRMIWMNPIGGASDNLGEIIYDDLQFMTPTK